MSDESPKNPPDEIGRTRPGPPPGHQAGGEFESASAIRREDRFDRIGRLGVGGMGVVDEVHDRLLDRTVARKVLADQLRGQAEALERFVREIRVTARLQHPGIVTVLDARLGEEEGPALYMPLLDGRPLSAMIAEAHAAEGQGLSSDSLADLLDVVIRVCDAVIYAHDEGVLHRDLKPANIMVGHYGEVYVLDWGIALQGVTDGDRPRFVTNSTSAGTPAYMAPETIEGRDHLLDVRTDIYAIGSMLYEIVAGRPAREEDGTLDTEAVLEIVGLGVSRAQELEPSPSVSPELVRIIRKATAPKPGDRHQSVAEFRHDLRRFLRGGEGLPRLSFRAGEAIVREGESGDAAYILLEGTCRVVQDRDGERRVRRDLTPGAVFGETALLSPGPRTASVLALTDAVLLEVTEETLEREVAALKPWLATLVRGLASRLREADGK